MSFLAMERLTPYRLSYRETDIPSSSNNERYYDFVRGPVHFFAIDSDSREPDGITSGSTQALWLQAQLAASTSKWKIVFMHHPPYSSSSSHGSTPLLQWPYEDWGATAVLAGHDHLYERIIRDENGDDVDFAYFTTGAGGRSLYDFGTPVDGSESRYNADYGSMIIEATSTSITFQFWSIAGGGTLIDTYTIGQPPVVPPDTDTATFQQGVSGYSGTVDTYLMEAEPGTVHGALESVEWDARDPQDSDPFLKKFALIRFDDIFGANPGQIPVGATIQSATLTYYVYNTGDSADVNEVAIDWSTGETYNGFGGDPGVQADEYGVALGTAGGSSGAQTINVTASLAAWASAPSANHGWIFRPIDSDGVDFRSSEYGTSSERPLLTVAYTGVPITAPPPPSDLGLTVVSHSRIDLAWTDNSHNEANETSFEIERTSTSDGLVIIPVPANTTSYQDMGLIPEIEYCYRVRARNNIADSDYTTLLCATTPEAPPYVEACEDFNTGYTLGAELRTHPDWFYEAVNSGPMPTAGIGVNGSIGLSDGERIFTWVAHPFTWSGMAVDDAVVMKMDFKTDGSGLLDDDRVGWMVSNTDDSSDHIFGVQIDPEGATLRLEGYWDGDTVGDDGGRPVIDEIAGTLTPGTWYRLEAKFTKISATSAMIEASLTELDGAGNPGATVLSGIIPDTSNLAGFSGPNESPAARYFEAGNMWPAYKNFTTAAAPADNACFGVEYGVPPTEAPLAPSGLGLTVESHSRIDLAWTDNSDNEATFKIERTPTSGAPVIITVPANTTSYQDTGLTPETEYCYRVWATNIIGDSGDSNQPCATTDAAPPAPSGPGFSETFELGFTLGADVGEHAEWFDGDDTNGPDVQSGIGCGASTGLAPGSSIFTWTEHPFDWNDPDLTGIMVQMDFQTNEAGEFDDDRLGWMITDTSTDSTNIFGVQLDHADGGIVTYWRDSSDTRVQDPIVPLSALTPNTWYRFRAMITKNLTATSVKIDVTLDELDSNCNPDPTGEAYSGTVENTSLWTGGTPDNRYFTADTMWPAFKNHSALNGSADNAYFEEIRRFAFVVVSDLHTSSSLSNVQNNLQQVKYWIDNPTLTMPAPQFMVVTGDFPDVSQTEAAIDNVVGADFLWFPVIGNHEISDNIANFNFLRDTMVPALPYVVDEGPVGSRHSSYSWSYGNAHFVAVNAYWNGGTGTGDDYAADGDIPVELRNWIDTDLQNSTRSHEFVFVHEPAYPDHRHEGDSLDAHPTNRDDFVAMLNANGAETLFSGHTHYYEHDVAPEFPLGDLHQVTTGALRDISDAGDSSGPTIMYVLVEGETTTYKAYHSTNGFPFFTLAEEWTIPSSGPNPTDMKGHWAFDDGTGTTAADDSIYHNDGVVNGASWVAGQVDGALAFNSDDDYVEIPYDASLALDTNQVTIACWINPSDFSQAWHTVIQRSISPSAWMDWQIYAKATDLGAAGRPVFRINWDGNNSVESYEQVIGNSTIPIGVWTHIAVTYDGNEMKFYINGESPTTNVVGARTIPNNGKPIWIGNNDNWHEEFHGKIDEVVIYDRALSQGEILSLMGP